jgi:hypothetical protein
LSCRSRSRRKREKSEEREEIILYGKNFRSYL